MPNSDIQPNATPRTARGVFGFTLDGRPLHVQTSYGDRPLVKIITAYQPDPNEWEDFRVRISPNGL